MKPAMIQAAPDERFWLAANLALLVISFAAVMAAIGLG